MASLPTDGFTEAEDVSSVEVVVGPADDGRCGGRFLFARFRAMMVSLMDGRVETAEVLCESAAAFSPRTDATEDASGNGFDASLRSCSCCFLSSDNRMLMLMSADSG